MEGRLCGGLGTTEDRRQFLCSLRIVSTYRMLKQNRKHSLACLLGVSSDVNPQAQINVHKCTEMAAGSNSSPP